FGAPAGMLGRGVTGRARPDVGTAGFSAALFATRGGTTGGGFLLDGEGISSGAESDGAIFSESSRASPRASRFSASASSSLSFSAMQQSAKKLRKIARFGAIPPCYRTFHNQTVAARIFPAAIFT